MNPLYDVHVHSTLYVQYLKALFDMVTVDSQGLK